MKKAFFTPESSNAVKIIDGVSIHATWNNGLLTIQRYDSEGYYIPGQTFEHDFGGNASLFEYLENRNFQFIS